ncbi:MAG TPA: immunoglobulin domain-containing protein, partial [Verrucomicrobiae bacterium]
MRIKPILFSLAVLSALTLRASVLFQDATNYPYANGCIEGQGQWFAFASKSSTNALDALVTNNVLYLNTANKDSVGTPTNGWTNPGNITWASFTLNLSQPPLSAGYFMEFRDTNGNSVCHLYNTTAGTTLPGTYRLGIGASGSSAHNDFPLDLATGVTYTVVVAYDTTVNSATEGANLMINPSFQDFNNLMNEVYTGPGTGAGFVFSTDIVTTTNLLNININYIGFSPYANGGISNVIAGTDFTNVITTNVPAIGIQPQSGIAYSGNPVTLYTVASGVDLTYQWYSGSSGALADGANISGSTSNVLTIASVSASD